MPNIKNVTFYFANPTQDINGVPVLSEPPESHTLTWQQVLDNVGFSLSTGESMFTELPDSEDPHTIRVVNGFYFGTGRYGSLLAIQYVYEDDTDGWISEVTYQSASSQNMDMVVGNWIKDKSYQYITTDEKWIGKPYIGYESDYVEVTVERIIPDIHLTLSPLEKTVLQGESITFEYSSVDYCDGEATYEWVYNEQAIQELSLTEDTHILQFNQVGTHTVEVIVRNDCGQEASAVATITVNESEEAPCELQLTPQNISIRLGDTATFDAIHPYSETGVWTYDLSMEVLEETQKKLQVKPKALGSYLISYEVNNCKGNSLLYVLEPLPETDWSDPVEPPPPALPDTPPDTTGTPSLVIELADASKPIPPLHKYPNIMKRNVRYRGQRESEKMLNDHQEQIYVIRQIYKDIESLDIMKDTTIDSWFNGVESISISMKEQENNSNSGETQEKPEDINVDSVRGFESDMVQLSGNSFEERIVGIYGIKRQMQELDERIAEAERRYREYENAYE